MSPGLLTVALRYALIRSMRADPQRATDTLDFLLILVTGHCIRIRDNCAGSRRSRSRSQRMSGRAQELGQSDTWGIFSSSQ